MEKEAHDELKNERRRRRILVEAVMEALKSAAVAAVDAMDVDDPKNNVLSVNLTTSMVNNRTTIDVRTMEYLVIQSGDLSAAFGKGA